MSGFVVRCVAPSACSWQVGVSIFVCVSRTHTTTLCCVASQLRLVCRCCVVIHICCTHKQAAEDFMVHLFEDCNLCAIHAKRVTISELSAGCRWLVLVAAAASGVLLSITHSTRHVYVSTQRLLHSCWQRCTLTSSRCIPSAHNTHTHLFHLLPTAPCCLQCQRTCSWRAAFGGPLQGWPPSDTTPPGACLCMWWCMCACMCSACRGGGCVWWVWTHPSNVAGLQPQVHSAHCHKGQHAVSRFMRTSFTPQPHSKWDDTYSFACVHVAVCMTAAAAAGPLQLTLVGWLTAFRSRVGGWVLTDTTDRPTDRQTGTWAGKLGAYVGGCW